MPTKKRKRLDGMCCGACRPVTCKPPIFRFVKTRNVKPESHPSCLRSSGYIAKPTPPALLMAPSTPPPPRPPLFAALTMASSGAHLTSPLRVKGLARLGCFRTRPLPNVIENSKACLASNGQAGACSCVILCVCTHACLHAAKYG